MFDVRCLLSGAAGASPAPWYLLTLVLSALGLMSKPMLVTVPFVLLLLDYWPLRRFEVTGTDSRPVIGLGPLLREKVPFFLLTIISCVVTVVAQRHGGAVQTLGDTSVGARVANALVSYARYLGKTIWPTGLATPYPNPGHWPVAEVLLALGLILALTLAAVWLGRRSPWLVTGWFWFVGMLVPVIGLVQAGDQSMADRYTYLPLIGVFLIAVCGASEALSRWRLPPAAGGVVAGLVLAACAVQARQQLGYWRNSETLFTHATAVTKGNWIAWFNLGCALEKQGRTDEALAAFRRTVEIKPAYADGQNRLGCALAARQQYTEAIACFEAVLRARPDFVEAHNNLAEAYRLLGKPDLANLHQRLFLEKAAANPKALLNVADGLAGQGQFAAAVPYYEAALRAGADPATAHYELANTLTKLGRLDEAIDHYRQALRQKPAYAEAHNRLGMALAAKGTLAEAETEFREAHRLEPNLAPALVNLGRVLTAERKLDEAIQVFRAAAPLAPANPDLHAHFAIALAMKGDTDEAAEQFRETLRYRPTDVVAHFNLGKILSVKGQTNEAIAHFSEALRLKPDFANARQELEALRGAQGPGGTR